MIVLWARSWRALAPVFVIVDTTYLLDSSKQPFYVAALCKLVAVGESPRRNSSAHSPIVGIFNFMGLLITLVYQIAIELTFNETGFQKKKKKTMRI